MNIFLNVIYFCDASWIFSIITPVFSVTWSCKKVNRVNFWFHFSNQKQKNFWTLKTHFMTDIESVLLPPLSKWIQEHKIAAGCIRNALIAFLSCALFTCSRSLCALLYQSLFRLFFFSVLTQLSFCSGKHVLHFRNELNVTLFSSFKCPDEY